MYKRLHEKIIIDEIVLLFYPGWEGFLTTWFRNQAAFTFTYPERIVITQFRLV